jgi:hypothetical protein
LCWPITYSFKPRQISRHEASAIETWPEDELCHRRRRRHLCPRRQSHEDHVVSAWDAAFHYLLRTPAFHRESSDRKNQSVWEEKRRYQRNPDRDMTTITYMMH